MAFFFSFWPLRNLNNIFISARVIKEYIFSFLYFKNKLAGNPKIVVGLKILNLEEGWLNTAFKLKRR